MSMRYKGGVISATPPATTTSYGIWTVQQQMQARGGNVWPTRPGAPTIGTASVASGTSVSVAFTAPACAGYPTSLSYTATATPGCFTNTGASSPIVVSGLTTGTAYTFKVKAANASGSSPCSAASNSVTPVVQGSQSYTSAGTYTWVAPACVSAVSVVAVGGGGASRSSVNGGGGGALGYKNNYSVTAGNSYTVVVGAGGTSNTNQAGDSYFVNVCTVKGGGGWGSSSCTRSTYTGDGGGEGGIAQGKSCNGSGAGGAGGYSGQGGDGQSQSNGCAGSGGGAGAGARGVSGGYFAVSGGGGVGLNGQGTNGAGAVTSLVGTAQGGRGGSGGGNGGATGNSTGGNYGGGAGTNTYPYCTAKVGAGGAVRIIWPGTTRSFPSTNAGSP